MPLRVKTNEPWSITHDGSYTSIRDNTDHVVLSVEHVGDKTTELVRRAVSCVNACEGVQQPQVAVQWAREAIAKVLDNISDLDDDARDKITEETFRALETAASALGCKA